jgi:hypothetical protein
MLLLAAGLVAPIPASAVPIVINFWIPALDPVTNQNVMGSFTFDSSSLPGPGSWVSPLTDPWDISFTYAGHTYTTADAHLNLITDADGNLHYWSLYSYPNTMLVDPGFVFDAFRLDYYSHTGGIEPTLWPVVWANDGVSPYWDMTTEPLPEPRPVFLFALGLPVALFLTRARRR